MLTMRILIFILTVSAHNNIIHSMKNIIPQLLTDACCPDPCNNNGTYFHKVDGGYKCFCPDGYYDPECMSTDYR
jgi:hypothetical protein